MFFNKAMVGSWLLAVRALSSAKSPIRPMCRMAWSVIKMLNNRETVTALFGFYEWLMSRTYKKDTITYVESKIRFNLNRRPSWQMWCNT